MIAPTKAQIEAGKPAKPTTKIELSTIERTLGEIASRGVAPKDLPAPSAVDWRPTLERRFKLTADERTALETFLTEEAALQAEISACSHGQARLDWYQLQRDAVSDPDLRPTLGESKRSAIEAAGRQRHAAKQALGAARTAIAKTLAPAGARLLAAADDALRELADAEALLAEKFGCRRHITPMQWALARSLGQLRETVSRGYCPADSLARLVGPLLPPPAK